VFENQTIYDNLELALETDRSVLPALTWRPSRGDRSRIGEILETVHLSDHSDALAGSLSHGQKQWLEIGMLLAQNPKLLLVDEPAAGMTDAETAGTARLLRRIARDHAVVVVEHDMSFIEALGVKVTCLHEGAVLAEGSLAQVSADSHVIDVYLGR
jgi:urea transport system ATP-binding protein